MRIFQSLAIVAAVSVVACVSLEPARMALPPALDGHAETVGITGIGGGTAGQFQAGSFSGSYNRSASRLAFLDPLYERRDAHTSFAVSGPDIVGALAVDCRMRERTITLSVVSFEPNPMAYGCTIAHEGRILPARIEVQAHREGLGGMMMRQERRGEIALNEVVLKIRSVHDLQGASIQMATPIGYVFEREGQAVGAVEINGAPVIAYGPDTDAATRRAILIASLALGLFWDPAESALGREAE